MDVSVRWCGPRETLTCLIFECVKIGYMGFGCGFRAMDGKWMRLGLVFTQVSVVRV